MLGTLTVTDINEALPRALPMLLRHGKPVTAASVANARPTIEWPGLFVTEYTNPNRCVLFDRERDANPLFHYLEAMWIIAGRQDVRFLGHVLPKMREYSDDGVNFHAPYGYRLRHWPTLEGGDSFDQIETAIHLLTASPTTRQVVMSIWNPIKDLGTKGKDLPCNDTLMLKVREGRLNLTVCNRSNDSIWGCYGANAVQFSMLLMYMAARIGVGIGTYHQMSDSFHVYEDTPYWQSFKAAYEKDPVRACASAARGRAHYEGQDDVNLFEDGIEFFDAELAAFFQSATFSIDDGKPVMQVARSTAVRNAIHIWNTLLHWRAGRVDEAASTAWMIDSADWRIGVQDWMQRRIDKKAVQA